MTPSILTSRPIPLRALALITSIAALLSTTLAYAAWLANGSPVTPTKTGAYGDCFPLSVAPDGAGGAYVVAGNTFSDARLGRVLGDGDLGTGWPSDGLSFQRYPFCPFLPVVIPDDAGGAFVISNVLECAAHWAGNATELVVNHVDSSGALFAGWPAEGLSIGSGFDRSTPILVLRGPLSISNGRGSAIITWARRQSFERGFSPIELRAQRVDATGVMPWGLGGIVLRSFTGLPFQQTIAPDGSGGAYVFWRDDRAPGLFAQHVLEDGSVSWTTDGIPVTIRPYTFAGPPVAVSDGARGAIVAWAGTSWNRGGVFAARLTPRGSFPWRSDRTVFTAGSQTVDELRMAPTPFSGAVLAWRVSAPGADDRILAQQLDREGGRRWPKSGAPVCEAVGARDRLAMAPDHRGGAYFAWVDTRPMFAIYAMHLEPSGDPARGWVTDGSPVRARLPLATSATGFVEVSGLAITSVGRADRRDPGDDPPDRREDGTLDPGARAEGDTYHPAGVFSGRPSGLEPGAIVAWVNEPAPPCQDSPSPGQSPYAMLLAPDGPATPPYTPARRSAVRNSMRVQGAPSAPPGLWLRSGGTAGANLTLSLLDASPASLELFDLAGRMLWSREIGQIGPGIHELSIGDGASYPSGIYLARVTQAGHAATARLAFIH